MKAIIREIKMLNLITPRNKLRNKLLAMLGLGAGLMFLIACAAQSPSPTNHAETSGSQALAPVNTVSADVIRPVVGAETYPIGSSRSASNQLAQDGNLTGISVSGQGQASGTPDLATVNLGWKPSGTRFSRHATMPPPQWKA